MVFAMNGHLRFEQARRKNGVLEILSTRFCRWTQRMEEYQAGTGGFSTPTGPSLRAGREKPGYLGQNNIKIERFLYKIIGSSCQRGFLCVRMG